LFLNEKGMSLLEISMATLLVGILGLGSMRMMDNTSKMAAAFGKSIDVLTLEKIISSNLLSKRGCEQFLGTTKSAANAVNKTSFTLRRRQDKMVNQVGPGGFVDKKIVSDFTDSSGADVIMYQEGDEIQNIQALDNIGSSDSGILTVKLVFEARDKNGFFTDDSRLYDKYVYVPVGLDDTSGDPTVSSCELSKNETFQTIVDTLCRDMFFRDTALAVPPVGVNTCAQTLLFVENQIKESICEDITGSAARSEERV
jgi:hypothetical protein